MTDVTPAAQGASEPVPPAPPVEPAAVPRRLWLILVAGVVVWIAVVITALTKDTILVPTVLILGTFLVPVGAVPFVLARPPTRT